MGLVWQHNLTAANEPRKSNHFAIFRLVFYRALGSDHIFEGQSDYKMFIEFMKVRKYLPGTIPPVQFPIAPVIRQTSSTMYIGKLTSLKVTLAVLSPIEIL